MIHNTGFFGVITVAAAVIIGAAGGCAVTPVAAPVMAEVESWDYEGVAGRKITTEHFEVYSTLADRELEDALPAFVEAAYQQYITLLPSAGDHPRLRTYLFNTRGQWERFAGAHCPERFPVYRRISAGGFAEGGDCVVYYIQRAYTLSVLGHEGLHQYFGSRFTETLPAWLNEGLACYCESFELPGGRPVFQPTRNTFRLNSLREALAGNTLLSLPELLSTDAGRVIVQGQTQLTRNYYAQVWALVVYLRHGGNAAYAAGFQRLLGDVADGGLARSAQAARIRAPSPSETSYGEAVFRAYITDDLQACEKGYRQYLEELAGFRPAGKSR